MSEPDWARIKRLIDRLLATRDQRDAEPRWSERWRALDDDLHQIERAVFRLTESERDVAVYRVDRAT
jgi:hypothetical protein